VSTVARWLIVYRRGNPLANPGPAEVIDADDIRCDGDWLIWTRQVLVLFHPRTVVIRRARLHDLASVGRLTGPDPRANCGPFG
jgi:hypothetical protein